MPAFFAPSITGAMRISLSPASSWKVLHADVAFPAEHGEGHAVFLAFIR
jgi:hypothetical protein